MDAVCHHTRATGVKVNKVGQEVKPVRLRDPVQGHPQDLSLEQAFVHHVPPPVIGVPWRAGVLRQVVDHGLVERKIPHTGPDGHLPYYLAVFPGPLYGTMSKVLPDGRNREQSDLRVCSGLKLIDSERQLTSLPRTFSTTIPEELADEVMENPAHAREIGRLWALRQAAELIEAKVPCIHFYVMHDAASVVDLVKELK